MSSPEGEPFEGEPVGGEQETRYEVVEKGNYDGRRAEPHLDVAPGQEWDFADLENVEVDVPGNSRLFAEKGVHLKIMTHPGAQVEVVVEDDVRITEREAA